MKILKFRIYWIIDLKDLKVEDEKFEFAETTIHCEYFHAVNNNINKQRVERDAMIFHGVVRIYFSRL